MSDFKRILFPVDLSNQCSGVAPFIKAMAERFGSEVVVLNASSQEGAAAELLRFVERELSGIRLTSQLVRGDAAQEIVRYAHSEKMDLIAMPSHGHGPFRSLLLGSVTAKVLHDAHCPVWTGVHSAEVMAHSPERWKRLLCAVDTDDNGERILSWTARFAREQRLDVKIVHSVAGADAMWNQQLEPSMYDFLFQAAREHFVKLQAKLGTSFEVSLVGRRVAGAVREAALDYDPDWVVIGRGAIQESLGRLQSHAYAIIRDAPAPVISI
jgi:nucleotide-binding universal stress UspA family protein